MSTNDLTSFCTTCDGVLKSTTCPTCGDVTNDDTAKILETISWDETPSSSARSDNFNSESGKSTRLNKNNKPFASDEIRIRSGSRSSSKSSPRTTHDQLDETSPASTVRDRRQKSSPKTPRTPQKSSLKSPSTPKKSSLKSPSNSQKSSPKTLQRNTENEEYLITPSYETSNMESESASASTKRTRFLLDEEPIEPCHIDPEQSSADGDLDSFFKKLELIPPNICAKCLQVKQVDVVTATEYCKCVLDVKARLLDTLLTDSDDDDCGYTDQETSHFGLNNRGRRPLLFTDDSQVIPDP